MLGSPAQYATTCWLSSRGRAPGRAHSRIQSPGVGIARLHPPWRHGQGLATAPSGRGPVRRGLMDRRSCATVTPLARRRLRVRGRSCRAISPRSPSPRTPSPHRAAAGVEPMSGRSAPVAVRSTRRRSSPRVPMVVPATVTLRKKIRLSCAGGFAPPVAPGTTTTPPGRTASKAQVPRRLADGVDHGVDPEPARGADDRARRLALDRERRLGAEVDGERSLGLVARCRVHGDPREAGSAGCTPSRRLRSLPARGRSCPAGARRGRTGLDRRSGTPWAGTPHRRSRPGRAAARGSRPGSRRTRQARRRVAPR